MRDSRLGIISAFAVILVGVLSLGAGAPAYAAAGHARPRLASAAPTITVTPTTVASGGRITVSGTGFAPNEPVQVLVSPQTAGLAEPTADANGVVPATTVRLDAATFAPGDHAVTLYGSTSRRTALMQITVSNTANVTIAVTPATVASGGQISVSGTGFAPHEPVQVLVSPQTAGLAEPSADANGVMPATTIRLDAATFAPGDHTVTLYGSISRRTAIMHITIAPAATATLTVTPGATTRGGAVSVSGGGFTPNEAVELTIDGVSTPLATLHADAAGTLPATTITIPYAATVGARTLTARGTTSGKTAATALTLNAVTATLTVVPASSTRGGSVTVSGSGFAVGETITVTIDDVATPLAVAHADNAGLLPVTPVTIPYTATVGARTLTATGAVSGRKATAPLTLTAVVATVSLVPATTNRGGLLTVSGANFAAGEAITITADGVITPLATITATAQGLVPPTGVSVPYTLAAGPHTLRLTGATSGRVATAPFTVAPLAPLIAVNPATASPGTVVTVSGSGFGRQERVTLALNGAALPTSPVVITTTNGAFTASFTATQSLLSGVNTVGAIGNESRVSAISGLAGSLPVAGTLYFAGASTLPGETASLPILNTHARRTHVILTFYYRNGAPGQTAFDVPAHSRFTADLNALAGPGRVFGVALGADRSVTAQVHEARQGRDGFGLLGVSAPSTTWYLAEGYTGLTFHETVALVNPGQTSSQVQVRLLPFGGRAARTELVTVPAQSTRTVDVNSLMPRQSLSVIATASRPIVVARILTFSSHNGAPGYGATGKTGTNAPATTWIFAEGTTTTRFQTYLTVLNPNATAALVTASFYGRTGGSLGSRTLLVPALSRANLKLNDFLTADGIATIVTANAPIVVERPEYFGSPNAPDVAGSDVFGRNGAGVAWSFPGGDTTTQGGFASANRSEFLLIYNPSGQTVAVDATFYGSDGTLTTKRLYISPTIRYNVDVNRLVPDLTPQHGITLRSANGVGFVAEQTVFAPDFSSLTGTQGFAQ